MDNVGSIQYVARIETSKLKTDAKGVEKIAKSTGDDFGNQMEKGNGRAGKAFKNFAKVAAVAIVAVGAATVAFATKSVTAYNMAIEAQTKLSTNLLNVKGNTEETVESLSKLAGALQSVGVIEDDVIKAGMSQLATFNLQGKTIETLTPKIADMVAQLKGHNATAEDMVGINNLVGKVMSGNVGALSRYGVTLNKNQADILKNGTESEKAAALVEILGQNYGDVNKALRNTPQGKITALKNEFGDFQERVGEFTLRTITPIINGFEGWLTSMGGFDGIFDRMERSLMNVSSTVRSAIPNMIALASGIAAYTIVANASTVATRALAAAKAALNGVMLLNPLALAAAAAVAIGVAYYNATTNGNALTRANQKLVDSKKNLEAASDAAKDAEDRLSGAVLDAEGAAFRAESAQKRYNDAVRDYGRDSLEARTALHEVKQATQGVADANKNVKDRTREALTAQNEIVKQKDNIVAAHKEIAAAVGAVSGQLRNVRRDAQDARSEIQKVQKEGGTVSARTQLRAAGLPSLNIPARAAGGPVSANSPYVVGENRDGSLNSTSELFVPRQSGSIVNSSDFQDMMGGSSIENNIGTINIASDVDADSFLKRLTQNQEIIGKGLTPATAY